MKRFFNYAWRSLLLRIVLAIFALQAAALIFLFAQSNLDVTGPEIPANDTASNTYHAVEYFSTYVTALENGSKPDDSISKPFGQKTHYVWLDIVEKNPDLWYYYRHGDFVYKAGREPVIADRLTDVLTGPIPGDTLCDTRDVDFVHEGFVILASQQNCRDQESSVMEVGGLSPDYEFTGLAGWELLIGPRLTPATLIASYLIVLLLGPLLFYFLLRPMRQASQEASKIRPGISDSRLPSGKVFAEAEGLVTSVNDALARLDVGFAREQRLRNAIAHELRSPLTALRARLDDVEPEGVRKELEGDVTRMTAMIDRLLEFARSVSESGNTQDCNLIREARAACAECGIGAISSGVVIYFDHADGDAILVKANDLAIGIILTNLINNAVHHGAAGKEVDVYVDADGSVTVRDYGPGLEKAVIQRLMDGQSSLTARGRRIGHGFGLDIVSELIALTGAKLTIDNPDGGGTRFTIQFGLADQAS